MNTPIHDQDSEGLSDSEREALDSMVDFDDLVEGDFTTEESLESPEDR